MFDSYEPFPEVVCPYCGTGLKNWQGKDGPSGLFVWRQGFVGPIRHDVDEPIPDSRLSQFRLPAEFRFRLAKVGCRFCPLGGIGHTEDQTWVSTTLIVLSDAPFHEQVDLGLGPHSWKRLDR